MLRALDATTGAAIRLGLRTLRNLRKGQVWAWLDAVCQHRRCKIGLLWETVNMLVTVVGYMTAYLLYRRMRGNLAFVR